MARGIRRLARGGRGRRVATGPDELRRLLDGLPLTLRRQALTHSSWVERRSDSYGRLAFLGDSVLGLAIAEHLFRRYPEADIGRLTKMHGQAVSGRARPVIVRIVRRVYSSRLMSVLQSSGQGLDGAADHAAGGRP